MLDKNQALPIIEKYKNKPIKALYRVVHIFEGQPVVENKLPFQIDFDDGTVAVFDAALDAESLVVSTEKWYDLMEGRTDADAVAYAEQYGTWELMDISDSEGFSVFIGQSIHTVLPIELCLSHIAIDNPPLTGVQLQVGNKTLIVVAMWEELHIYLSDNDKAFKELPVKVVYNTSK
jgi:hypothetical protein